MLWSCWTPLPALDSEHKVVCNTCSKRYKVACYMTVAYVLKNDFHACMHREGLHHALGVTRNREYSALAKESE